MTQRIVGSACITALLSLTLVRAQVAPQTPTQSPARPSGQVGDHTTARGEGKQLTLTGCVEREGQYLVQARHEGRALEPTGNEFVLAEAAMTDLPTELRHEPEATGEGQVYSLVGEQEQKLVRFVGQRVEITGTREDDVPVGTTGTDAARHPRDTEAALRPEHTAQAEAGEIPELDVSSIRRTGSEC